MPIYICKSTYFRHTQRMVAPRDHMDHHIAWDHRRLHESLKHYDGSLLYYTGVITFKQDMTLGKDARVPVELGQILLEPPALTSRVDVTLLVKDRDRGLVTQAIAQGDRTAPQGRIADDGYIALFNSAVGYMGFLPLEGDWRYTLSRGRLTVGVGEPGATYKAGDTLTYAFVSGMYIDEARDEKRLARTAELIRGRYPVQMIVGKRQPGDFLLTVQADDHQARFKIGPAEGWGIDMPIRVAGLVDNGVAAVHTTQRPWFRFIGIQRDEGSAYLQEPAERENTLWVGNVFVSDHPEVLMTLVVDGQDAGKPPRLEVHNPTDKPVTTRIHSPAGTPMFGGQSHQVEVPAGHSVWVTLTSSQAMAR